MGIQGPISAPGEALHDDAGPQSFSAAGIFSESLVEALLLTFLELPFRHAANE